MKPITRHRVIVLVIINGFEFSFHLILATNISLNITEIKPEIVITWNNKDEKPFWNHRLENSRTLAASMGEIGCKTKDTRKTSIKTTTIVSG